MNKNLKPGIHPEAELLNAFAEHELSPAEQRPVLAHLADCNRCRQIVFLAQEAAAIDDQPNATALPMPSRPWWSNWSIVWIAAPACAALLTIAVFLNLKPIAPVTQRADVTKPPIQPTAPHASAMDRSVIASQSTEQKTARFRDKLVGDMPQSAQASPPSLSISRNTEPAARPRPAMSFSTVKVKSESAAPALIVSAGASRIEPASKPIPPLPEPSNIFIAPSSSNIVLQSPTVPSAAASIALSPQPIPSPRAAPMPPHAIPNAARPGSMHSVSGTISGRNSVTLNGAPLQKQAFSALADATARKILYTKLPNGLTAVSTAAVFTAATQHRLVALDTAGTLFRSEDEGTTWQPISIQWTGRPLQVRTLQMSASPTPASPGPASPRSDSGASSSLVSCPTCASTSIFSPEVKFELITDAVSTFTSTDGLTWSPKLTPKSAPQPPQAQTPAPAPQK
jgi:hypothetical protein